MSINKELELAVLNEKLKGTSDIEIGKKFGISFKNIEKIITRIHGINVSSLNVSKKNKKLSTRRY